MTNMRQALPAYFAPVLQGLTFWMGHRDQIFHLHPLTEAAIVTEACNLFQAKIKTERLFCEVPYSRICNGNRGHLIAGSNRADLVISAHTTSSDDIKGQAINIFECKRASTSKKEIEKDLHRLYQALAATDNNARAFLILVGQKLLPKEYVFASTGKAIRKNFTLEGMPGGKYAVRRTCKAAASFANKETAYYACLIEVMIDRSKIGESK